MALIPVDSILICNKTTAEAYVQFQKWPPEVFCKKGILKKLQISKKTPLLESLLNKVAGLQVCNFTKKRLHHRCHPVKFVKYLRIPILKNICERLLLQFLSHGSEFITYVMDLSTKNKVQRRGFIFLQKQKIKTVGNRKKIFFSQFISENPNFSYLCFFRKSSMFCRNIPLKFFQGLQVFKSFIRKQKSTRNLQRQEDINVVVIIALSSTKPCLSFLKFNF